MTPNWREVLERQVDPAAAKVLADVADEVGELERDAEVPCVPADDVGLPGSGSRTGTICRPMTAAEPYT